MEKIKEGISVMKTKRTKNQIKDYQINQKQSKFFVDLSNEKESLDLIFRLLAKCNKKNFGSEILFKHLCLYAVSKLTDKDVEKIQESSLSEMEKVERALFEYNSKNNTSLSMGEFLIKKLGIN
jgi:CMP-2-keto-3-deoxyoctulosonic acid synthetase